MNFKDYKYEIIIGSSLAIMLVSLFMNILSWKPRKSGFFNNVSFEMIRPQSDFHSEYSLQDRSIDKEFINPFKKKEKSETKVSKNTKPKLVPIKKKVVKKEEPKKASNPVKKGVQVRLIPKEKDRGLSPSDNFVNNQISPTNIVIPAVNKNNINNNDTLNEDKNKKTAADFSDLGTNPTSEKVNALILAYKKSEISTSEFYKVIGTMLQSSNPNSQSLGVYVCYSFPNAETFSLVTIHLDNLNAQVANYANEFLYSFNNQAKLQYLGQALQSNDIKIVSKAGEVIILGLQKIKNGQTISYVGRDGRGNNDISSLQSFEFLLPIAENLQNSGNQSLASVGLSISQEMGTTTVTN